MSIKNKVQLVGNLGEAAVIKNLDEGSKVANFSLATNESYTNKEGNKVENTEWHNLVAWGKTAEIIEKYTQKGSEIAIEGKLQSSSYETKEGEKRYKTEIRVNEVLLLGKKQ